MAFSRAGSRRVVGLMSGTSADGIDAVVVELTRTKASMTCRQLAFRTVPLKPDVRAAVLRLCEPEARVEDLCTLNVVLGEAFAAAALAVIRAAELQPEQVDLIGSHGQTVRHLPGACPPATLQIGEPAVIAQRTGIVTVADFRPADMAVGGQGAPLVPLADHLLFGHPEEDRLILNIGGIANVTVLPAGAGLDSIRAFDLGPGNAPIDAAVDILTGGRERYDRNGARARRGRIDQELLTELLRHPFLRRPPPKSTGREEFGADFVRGLMRRHRWRDDDWVATLTAFSAAAIAAGLRDFVPVSTTTPAAGLWVGGGGWHNPELRRHLQHALPAMRLESTAALGIDPDAREAIAFAILAVQTVDRCQGNVPGATGAARGVTLGKIVLP